MTDNQSNTDERLIQYLERIERLKEQVKGLNDDISDIYKEAASSGYDAPTMKNLIKVRKMDAQKRTEQLELFDLYLCKVGMA